MTHATVSAYTYHGCRCSPCVTFIRTYWRTRKAIAYVPKEPRPPLVDPASAREMALLLWRRWGLLEAGHRYDERHDLADGSGQQVLVRVLRGLRWGVTHTPGPTAMRRVTEETEDRLWVML